MGQSEDFSARLARITNDSTVESVAVLGVNVQEVLPAGTAYVEVFVTPASGATVFWQPGSSAATVAGSTPVPPLSRQIYDVGPDGDGDPVTMNFISDDAVNASAVRILVVAG